MARIWIGTAALAVVFATTEGAAFAQGRIDLHGGWTLQSSASVKASGDALSRPDADVSGWYKITVPNTVVGALVQNGHFKDEPFFGMNLRSIPGTTYPVGANFANLPTPADSPFKVTWWYRKDFQIPAAGAGRHFWLHFNGINYRANIWLNGQRIASSEEIAGAYRRYELDVTRAAKAGTNVLAVEVRGPEPEDLGITWVDWNPAPPDKDMGLWGDVYLTDSGPLTVRHPQVVTDLDLPSLDRARLTVTAEVGNAGDAPVKGTLRGRIGEISFSQPVSLGAHEQKVLTFNPDSVAVLTIQKPRVWWPYRMGPQNLYTLSLQLDANGKPSDSSELRFGIENITSELTDKGYRLFRINGRPILIRGGGWAPDMMLRPKSTGRLEAELRYTKEMGLNAIRLEGKLESDEFFDLADREGILIMPGWCCCDQWEKWDKWTPENRRVAPASLRDQIYRLRTHPSIFVWLNGSDNPPTPDVEREYLGVLKELKWQKPIVSSATEKKAASGPSGVKMRGPYDYVPPSYWLTDTKNGGAFGFATEISPGEAVPPIESLRAMLPEDKLWPRNEVWDFHAGGGQFKSLKPFTEALEARFGPAKDAVDYARKAQALAYEGQRAMFEGYARNKYTSTGVIQWMLNNAWPSMIWHLYDYYLRPGGGYFGTKKACEPVHVQYSYDDRSIVVVNDTQEALKGLKVAAAVYDVNMTQKYSDTATIDSPADSVTRALVVPKPADLTAATYFLRLTLTDNTGKEVSNNFYWLSTKEDVLDWANTKWYYTPTKEHADLTAIGSLPETELELKVGAIETLADENATTVRVTNTGKALAFQVRLKLTGNGGQEVLPVFWQDNYIALMPGENRELRVAWPRGTGGTAIRVEAAGWNTSAVSNR